MPFLTSDSVAFFGDGVVAALRPRITSEYSPHSHEEPLKGAVDLDRLVGILGAGGKILAFRSGVRGDSSLVKSDEF